MAGEGPADSRIWGNDDSASLIGVEPAPKLRAAFLISERTDMENGPSVNFCPRRNAETDLQPGMSSRRALFGLARRPLTCLFCEARRSFTSTALRAARAEKPGAGARLDPQASVAGTPIEAPRSYGKRFQGEFTPKPLPRPIGMPLPPKAGENTGIDHRSLKQRKEDFVNYDKHLQRRQEL